MSHFPLQNVGADYVASLLGFLLLHAFLQEPSATGCGKPPRNPVPILAVRSDRVCRHSSYNWPVSKPRDPYMPSENPNGYIHANVRSSS